MDRSEGTVPLRFFLLALHEVLLAVLRVAPPRRRLTVSAAALVVQLVYWRVDLAIDQECFLVRLK